MINKIAIVQNKIIWGGRLDLIAHVIKYLNERDIVPEIITFQVPDNFSKDEVFNYYGIKPEFKLKLIYPTASKLPFEYNIFIFNLLINRYKNHYDLFFNISNHMLTIGIKCY